MNRTLLTIAIILLYLVAFNTYIYLLSNGMLNPKERRLWYYYITATMTLFSWIDLKTITSSYYHNGFNDIAFCALFANFVLNILNHHGIFNSNGASAFLTFNGLFFVLTTMILISGGRHGHFETKNG